MPSGEVCFYEAKTKQNSLLGSRACAGSGSPACLLRDAAADGALQRMQALSRPHSSAWSPTANHSHGAQPEPPLGGAAGKPGLTRGGLWSSCDLLPTALSTKKMWAFPLQRVDGTPGMLDTEESQVPDPASLPTGLATLDVSPPRLGSRLRHWSNNKAALDHFCSHQKGIYDPIRT